MYFDTRHLASSAKVFLSMVCLLTIGLAGTAQAQNVDSRARSLFGNPVTPLGVPIIESGVGEFDKMTADEVAVRRKTSFEISAGSGYTYDTNPFQSDDLEDSDQILTGTGQFRLSHSFDAAGREFALGLSGGLNVARHLENEELDLDTAFGVVGIGTALGEDWESQLAYSPKVLFTSTFEDRIATLHDLELHFDGKAYKLCDGDNPNSKECTLTFQPSIVLQRRFADPSDAFASTAVDGSGTFGYPLGNAGLALGLTPAISFRAYDDFPGESRYDVQLQLGARLSWTSDACDGKVVPPKFCMSFAAGITGTKRFSTVDANDFDALSIGPAIEGKMSW